MQRIGRANHRLEEPSRALLTPSNRFEVVECRAAQEAVAEGALDGAEPRVGGLDCLAQHIMGCCCGEPTDAGELYQEVVSTVPYSALSRAQYDAVFDVVATGGYALAAYDRYRRIVQDPQTGRWRVRNASIAQQHRMNVGAIIESEMLDVRLAHRALDRRRLAGGDAGGPRVLTPGRRLGAIEEYFIEGLTPGDTFIFAGEMLRFIGVRESDALVVRARGEENPRIPSYAGGKFPLSSFLAARVRRMLHEPGRQKQLQYQPDHVLMQAAFADAGEGYLDLRRLGGLLKRVKGRIVHRELTHVSPFSAPVMLEMGRVPVQGAAEEAILLDAAALIEEAMA